MNAARFFSLMVALLLLPAFGFSQRVFRHPEILDQEIGRERSMVLRDIKFPFTTDDTILRGNGMDTIKLVFRQSKLQAFLFCRSFDSTQLNAASMLQTRLEKKMKTRYQFSNSYFESTGATSLFYMVKGRAGLTKDHDKKQLQCDLNLWQKYADGRYTVVMFVMP